MADSYLSGAAMGPGASYMLGGSAFASAYNQAIDKGASRETALVQGVAQGVSETLFEYLSLDKLFNGDVSGSVIKSLLQQGGIEASEELCTSIANHFTDRMIMGDKSEYELAKKDYMAKGKTEDEASRLAKRDFIESLVADAMGGFLSGGGMAAVQSGVKNKNAKRIYGSDSEALVAEVLELNPNNSFAQKMQERLNSGKELSGSQLRRLVDQNEAVIAKLGDAETESTAVNDNPATHTAEEMRQIEEYKSAVDPQLVQFVEESKAGGKANDIYALETASDRAVSDIRNLTGIDVTGFKTGIERRQIWHILKRHGANGRANQSMSDSNDIGRIQYVLNNYDTVTDGGTSSSYTTVKVNGKPGQAKVVVFSKKIDGTYYVAEAVPDTKRKTLFVTTAYIDRSGQRKTGTSQLVNAQMSPVETPIASSASVPVNSSVPQNSSAVNSGLSIEEASKKYGDQAKAMIATYNQGQDVAMFDRAYGVAYEMGKSGVRFDYVKNSDAVSYMTVEQTEHAYNAGAYAAKTESKTGEGAYGLQNREEVGGLVNEDTLNRIDTVGKLFGHKITLADLGSDNGLYDPETGEIVLDIAPLKSGSVNPFLFSVAHELGHGIRARLSMEAWSSLENYAIKIMGGETAIKAKQKEDASYAKRKAAKEDVVCDFLGKLLSDKVTLDIFCAAVRSGEFNAQHAKGIGGMIRRFLNKLTGKVNSAQKELAEGVQIRFGTDLKTAMAAADEILKAAEAALEAKENAVVKAVSLDGNYDLTDHDSVGYTKQVKKARKQYWKPKLTKAQWGLLEMGIAKERYSKQNWLNDIDKWLYKSDGYTQVFAIYSVSNVEDPTVLYAVGGRSAILANIYFNQFLEERHGTDERDQYGQSEGYRDRDLLIQNVRDHISKKKNRPVRNSGDGNGRTADRNAGVPSGTTGRQIEGTLGDGRGSHGQGEGTESGDGLDVNTIPKKSVKTKEDLAQLDADYMAAVESGDMETAQRMVDEAAKRSMPDSVVVDEKGKLLPMYHGTANGGFTVFDLNRSNFGLFGYGAYFTENADIARQYTDKGRGTNKQVYKVYLNIKNPIDMDSPVNLEGWRNAFNNADLDLSYLADVKSNEDAFRAMKEALADEGYYKYNAEEIIFDAL